MKNAILIGNGFTSQLNIDYLDKNMKMKLKKLDNLLFKELDEIFSPFRFLDANISLDSIDRKEHIIHQLELHNFENIIEVYDLFFVKYGLINETINVEVYAIESILKIVKLFRVINSYDEEFENRIMKLVNRVYYNGGKYGLKDTTLETYDGIMHFFDDFDSIFTTNYDLILDDICRDEEKVFHLHGSFRHKRANLKSEERLNGEDAFLLWGVHAEEKLVKLGVGFSWSNFRWDSFSWGDSLLKSYLSKIENDHFDEFHIFGFSGENDQHINDSICKNTLVRRIFFYCNPNLITNKQYENHVNNLFKKSSAVIELVPWTNIWKLIR